MKHQNIEILWQRVTKRIGLSVRVQSEHVQNKQRMTKKIGLSARGQMAIFIVLIFQVLFVFFAMIVNVGIVVHHKINLQNAVDLGAYYAASKQAEVLNAISHYNYQIRQAYKLLSWRNRVLGAMVEAADPTEYHPFLRTSSVVGDIEVSINPENGLGSPYVCTQWSLWSHIQNQTERDENFCANLDSSITDPPEFPAPQPPVFPAPWNIVIYHQMQQAAERFAESCKDNGVFNFQMAALWMRSYREAVRLRVEKIEELALSLSGNTFSDIDGGSVFEGTVNTVRHNLTRGNSFEESDLTIFNSLEMDQIEWLKKAVIYPRPFYLDSVGNGGLCELKIKPCDVPPNGADQMAPEVLQRLLGSCIEPREANQPFISTIGFEKNPWYVAYVGVEAQVQSIQPFMPLTGGITLTAKAYAKPFGGRIGPWLHKTWPSGESKSNTNVELVDSLLPARSYLPPSSESEMSAAIAKAIPNYSRFPGDRLGLKSGMALASMGRAFSASVIGSGTKLKISDWMNPEGLSSNPVVRSFEIAAMAPDVFDITYYSIDPHFGHNYSEGKLKDFGNESTEEVSTVVDQMTLSRRLRAPDPLPTSYMVQDPAHLLTGWTPNQDGEHFNYDFPEGEFGVCPSLASSSSSIGLTRHGCPGRGGRAGYSVKLISPEYLKKPQMLGGDGSLGLIQNPPP